MNISIRTITDPSGTGDARDDTYLAIVRGEGRKALGEGQNERAAVMDGLNSYFTAKQHAETVARNETTIVGPVKDFDMTITLPTVRYDHELAAEMYNKLGESGISASATFEAPGPILSKRVATDSPRIKELMEEAVEGQLLVDATYEKENGDRSERRLHPFKVEDRALAQGRLSGPTSTYILAVDQRSGEPRTFRLDRFERAEIVG